MIAKIVITKITRAYFGKREPAQVMIGFFDESGTQVGSQLLDAILFDEDIQEGQSINFKKVHTPFHDYMSSNQ